MITDLHHVDMISESEVGFAKLHMYILEIPVNALNMSK